MKLRIKLLSSKEYSYYLIILKRLEGGVKNKQVIISLTTTHRLKSKLKVMSKYCLDCIY